MNSMQLSKYPGFSRTLIASLVLHGILLAALAVWTVPTRTAETGEIQVYLAMSSKGIQPSPVTDQSVDNKTADRGTVLERKERKQANIKKSETEPSAGLNQKSAPSESPIGEKEVKEISPSKLSVEKASETEDTYESSIELPGMSPGVSPDHRSPVTTLSSTVAAKEDDHPSLLAFTGDPAALGIITRGAPGTGLISARPLSLPEPVYPLISRKKGEEGRVVLEVEVSSEGGVLGAQITESSSHFRLDQAALKAVKGAVFTPATESGMPVRSKSRVAYRFELEGW